MINQTILVTGGAGFIGSHLVRALLHSKARVIVIDDFSAPDQNSIRQRNIEEFSKNPDFLLLKGSILDNDLLDSLVKKPIDSIVHLAALAGVRNSIIDPEKYFQVNVVGTLRLLEFAKKKKVHQFILSSSSSVYGSESSAPFEESQVLGMATSPYAASKLAAESICQTYHFLYGIQTTILRLFSVYGPPGRIDMAPHIFATAILNKKPITVFGSPEKIQRDYTYIEDVIAGFMAALQHPLPLEIINLGSQQPITLLKLIQEIEKNLNRQAIIEQKDANKSDLLLTHSSVEKAKRLLYWEPKTTYSTGIRQFCEWMKLNRRR